MATEFSIKEISIFNRLANETLEEISAMLQPIELSAGEILFNIGDPGDYLVIVEQGKIAIFAPVEGQDGNEKPIRIFGPGEVLGEMALIDQQPRSLSARAEEPTKILTLGQKEFKRLLIENPEMGLSVMAGLNDRIRYTTDFLNEVRQWVQKVASGDYQTSNIEDQGDQYQDETIATLAAEFAQMTDRVQKREEALRQKVLELRIEVDEAKRKQDVEEILESDYYQSLKEKAKRMRQNKDDTQ
jgi:CRP-like cAMP-binding protein